MLGSRLLVGFPAWLTCVHVEQEVEASSSTTAVEAVLAADVRAQQLQRWVAPAGGLGAFLLWWERWYTLSLWAEDVSVVMHLPPPAAHLRSRHNVSRCSGFCNNHPDTPQCLCVFVPCREVDTLEAALDSGDDQQLIDAVSALQAASAAAVASAAAATAAQRSGRRGVAARKVKSDPALA